MLGSIRSAFNGVRPELKRLSPLWTDRNTYWSYLLPAPTYPRSVAANNFVPLVNESASFPSKLNPTRTFLRIWKPRTIATSVIRAAMTGCSVGWLDPHWVTVPTLSKLFRWNFTYSATRSGVIGAASGKLLHALLVHY